MRLRARVLSLFHSCAMSTLTLARLRRGIREHWEVLGDLEADAVEGLYPWETALVEQWMGPGARVAVAGCGSGRELLPLASRGCRVAGVDPAAHALAIARRALDARALTAELIEGFAEDTSVPGGFDVIWFSGASYSLIPESARRISTLRRWAQQLLPGGVVILNFQFPLARPRAVVTRASRIAGALARSDWRMEAGDRFGFLKRNGQRFYSYGHAFTLEEFEGEAAAAGLRVRDRQMPYDFAVYVLEPVAR
jgi:SAM-dependent methyltransferase